MASLETPAFDVALVEGAGHPVLRLRGELDLAGVGQLEAPALRLLDAGATQVVLDLSELEFLDVSGVNALLGLDRAARALGRRLLLRRPRTQAADLLRAVPAASTLLVEP